MKKQCGLDFGLYIGIILYYYYSIKLPEKTAIDYFPTLTNYSVHFNNLNEDIIHFIDYDSQFDFIGANKIFNFSLAN